MRRMWMWCLLAVLSTATVAWPQKRVDAGKAVLALEQQWLKGQKANNPELVAPLLADKIVITEADGKVLDKAGTLATYQKQNGIAPTMPT